MQMAPAPREAASRLPCAALPLPRHPCPATPPCPSPVPLLAALCCSSPARCACTAYRLPCCHLLFIVECSFQRSFLLQPLPALMRPPLTTERSLRIPPFACPPVPASLPASQLPIPHARRHTTPNARPPQLAQCTDASRASSPTSTVPATPTTRLDCAVPTVLLYSLPCPPPTTLPSEQVLLDTRAAARTRAIRAAAGTHKRRQAQASAAKRAGEGGQCGGEPGQPRPALARQKWCQVAVCTARARGALSV